MWNKQRYCWQNTEPCLNPEVLEEQLKKLLCSGNVRISSWFYDVEGHAKKCVERYCELAQKNKSTIFQSIYSMHWWPSLQRRRNKIWWRIVKNMHLTIVWSRIVNTVKNMRIWNCWECKMLHNVARIGRSEKLWSVNTLARSSYKMDRSAPRKLQTRKISCNDWCSEQCWFFPLNVNSSCQEALLYIFEDNETVIKMIIKGKKPYNDTCFQNPQSCSWLVFRSNQFGPKIQIKYIDTKNQLADILTKGNFTRDEWNHLLCLFNISHFSSTNCLEVMSKRTQEDTSEKRVTEKSKPMMNLVSRCSVRDPDVLASTAQKAWEKTRYESQILLSSWNEQQPRTERPVMGACSSDYSEWNADEKWSSQEWKSDEMLDARTVRRVGGQPFTQHTDKFVIEDDDMDSNTATESDGEWSSAKDVDQSSKDATQDSNKHSLILLMFKSSTLQASVFIGKNYS